MRVDDVHGHSLRDALWPRHGHSLLQLNNEPVAIAVRCSTCEFGAVSMSLCGVFFCKGSSIVAVAKHDQGVKHLCSVLTIFTQLENTDQGVPRVCKFLGGLTRLEPTATEGELWIACEGTGVNGWTYPQLHTFCSADQGVQDVCASFFARMLGSVLNGQPTVILSASFRRRDEEEEEREKEKNRKMHICNSRNFMRNYSLGNLISSVHNLSVNIVTYRYCFRVKRHCNCRSSLRTECFLNR